MRGQPEGHKGCQTPFCSSMYTFRLIQLAIKVALEEWWIVQAPETLGSQMATCIHSSNTASVGKNFEQMCSRVNQFCMIIYGVLKIHVQCNFDI